MSVAFATQSANCTQRTAGPDVKRTLRIAARLCAPKRAGRPRQHSPFVAAKVIDDGHKN
jgi:hypothetical protein